MPSRRGIVYNLVLFKQDRKRPKPSHLELLGPLNTTLPASYNISVPFSAYDQGSIGSCTANAICGAFRIQAPSLTPVTPSRMFLYYVERAMEHDIGQEGAALDDGFNVIEKTGVCPESAWPYSIPKENVKPSAAAYKDAAYTHISSWGYIAGTGSTLLANVKQVIANGNPVVIGILVYDSFESDAAANTGIIPMPNTNTEELLGGHALAMVGWDDTKQAFLVMNSWGTDWGTAAPGGSSRGFCWIPYAYIENANLCDECMFSNGDVISAIPTPPPPTKKKKKKTPAKKKKAIRRPRVGHGARVVWKK